MYLVWSIVLIVIVVGVKCFLSNQAALKRKDHEAHRLNAQNRPMIQQYFKQHFSEGNYKTNFTATQGRDTDPLNYFEHSNTQGMFHDIMRMGSSIFPRRSQASKKYDDSYEMDTL